MSQTPRTLVLYDCDGTLVDSQHQIVGSLTDAFSRNDIEPPGRADIRAIIGLSLEEAVAHLQPDLTAKVIDRICEAYRDTRVEAAKNPDEALYEGAAEHIQEMAKKERLALGIATGKSRRGLDRVLSSHGLFDHFETLQTADLHPSKPHPSMVHTALEETLVTPEHCVLVGDTDFDLMMGRAAGIKTIGVTWGYHSKEQLLALAPFALVDNFAELRVAIHEALSL